MSSENFKCIFCKETFDDKESLQVHFRRHGDLNFHQNKKKPQDDQQTASDKPAGSKDQQEMVQCDVCPEMFTSISKAITHKHKFHPDHDAKYFCPWCGKLFTMKHLYNKHIQTTHPKEEIAEHTFCCDVCKVYFNKVEAITYHNKFFHRVEEMPSIGNSKKLRVVGQEAVQIYYCPFCGEEYENKVNLKKHMTDEHSDENQHPDDVFRCPLCDAIFYHLDAYELHLTYHSIEDIYSERNQIVEETTEFSLESVPPLAEKVETLDFDAPGIGIEQLFEATMGLDDSKVKKKKHKKHKKSKKSAITLDQFLNMNTDVFGEGLDFQGIEEVPTQVITKRLKKLTRKPGQSKLPPNIEKLQRQGIVIKKKPGPSVNPLVLKGNVVLNKNSKIIAQSKANTADDNIVITKLMNQNNSIKIMKKANSDIKSTDGENNVTTSPIVNDILTVETKEPNGTSKNSLSMSDEQSQSTKNNSAEPSGNADDVYPDNTSRKSSNPEKGYPQDECINDFHHSAKDSDIPKTEDIIEGADKLSALRNNSNIVIKCNKEKVPDAKVMKESKVVDEDTTDCEDDINEGDISRESKKTDSLNAIKHLNHLTVKSSTQENTEKDKNNTQSEKKVPQLDISKIAHLIRNNPNKSATNLAKTNDPAQKSNKSATKTKDIDPEENHFTDDEFDDRGKILQPDVSKIAHLIGNNLAKSSMKPAKNIIIAQPPNTPVIKTIDKESEENLTDDEFDNPEKESQPDVSRFAHLLRNNPTNSALNVSKTNIAQQSNSPLIKAKDLKLEENRFTGDQINDIEKVPQTDVSKIAHLLRNNPATSASNPVKTNIIAQQLNKPATKPKDIDPKENRFIDDEFNDCQKVSHPDVSKIAHLLRNNPAKSVADISQTNVQKPHVPPIKARDIKSEENHFTDDESDETVDTNTEPAQAIKLANILKNPHLNIQTVKKSPKIEPQLELRAENSTKNEKINTDLLKHLKNVTAKPVAFNKSINVGQSPKVSPKQVITVKKEPGIPPIKQSKVINEDIEIFNIDDSDSDETNGGNTQVIKPEKLEPPARDKSMDTLRNINKSITIKTNSQNMKKTDKLQDNQFDSECEDEEIQSRANSYKSPQTSQKQSALNNVLKNLSKNITVKSGNSSPGYFPNQDRSRDSFPEDDGSESDTDSTPGRVKIMEMNAEEGEHSDTSDHIPQVQYPDSNSDEDGGNHPDGNFSEDDIESHIAVNTVPKTKDHTVPNLKSDSLKNVCKDLVIRPSGANRNRSPQATFNSDEIPPFAKSLSNQISNKNLRQGDNINKQITHNQSMRKMEKTIGRSINKSSVNQKMVNKEVKTVKTFQTQTKTETVVQEITTTVTKTIKTINQSSKQEVKSVAQSNVPQRFPQVIGGNSNFQSVKIRQAAPRVRNPGMRPTRPALPAPSRPNQLVPVRPHLNTPRQNNPRMPVRPSTRGTTRHQIKVAPGVTGFTAKRTNTEPPAGHFSCFKKPKESLFPEADFSAMTRQEADSPVQFSAVHMSKSNSMCATKTVKGNSVVTSTQIKSEMSASSQQLGKLRNLSGLSVMKTSQANQSHVEERTEISPAKQNTLNAIQRLQSQGLLVKKPRLASDEQSNPVSEDLQHFSDEEFDS